MGLLNRNVTTSKCLPDKNLVSSNLKKYSVEIHPKSKKSKISSGPHVELSEGLTIQSLRNDQKIINVPNNFDSIDILEENVTKAHQSIRSEIPDEINTIEFQPTIDFSTIDPLELQIEDIKVDVEDVFVNINEEISEKPKTTSDKTIDETKVDPLHVQVKCDYCDFSFENDTRLKLHIHKCHKELTLCKVCDHVFETPHDLKNHIKTVHEGKKTIYYDFCDFKAKRRKSLQKHNVKQLHKCHVCSGLEFKSEILLNSHIASIHTKKIKCEICDISFNSKVQLLKHRDKNHKNKLTIATKDGQKQKFQQNQKTKKKGCS